MEEEAKLNASVISHIKISEQSSRKRYVPYLFPSCVNFFNIPRWTPPKFLWLEVISFCTKHVYLFVQFPSAINIGPSALNLPLPGQKYLWAKMTWPILSKPNFPYFTLQLNYKTDLIADQQLLDQEQNAQWV